jgi:hypothetical protein
MRKIVLVVLAAVLAITTIVFLNIIRSNMLAEQRALKTAVVEYSTLRRIHAQPAVPHLSLGLVLTRPL